MDTSFSLPVTSVSTVGTTAAGGVQTMASPVFGGTAVLPFDILMQQLLSSSADSGQSMPQGTFAQGMLPVMPQTFSVTDAGDSDSLMVSVDQLNMLLTQLTDGSPQPLLTVPAIVQEMQSALAQALALGESEVNLSPVFANASSQDLAAAAGFLGVSQSATVSPVLTSAMSAATLNSSETAASVLTADQQSQASEALKQQLLQAVTQYAEQKGELIQSVLPSSTQVHTAGMPQANVGQGSGMNQNQTAASVFTTQTGSAQGTTAVVADTNILPQYDPSVYVTQPILTGDQKELVTTIMTAMKPQQDTAKSLSGDGQQSLLDSLLVGDSVQGRTGDLTMRSSLNLAMDGQQQHTPQNQMTHTAEQPVSSERTTFMLDENIQRLQEVQSIMKQISRQASIYQSNQNSEITVKLEPDYLGKVQIRVAMENNVINAHLTVDSAQVKQMLDANMGALKSALTTSDLTVESVDVSVAAASASDNAFIGMAEHGKNLANQGQQGAAQQWFDGDDADGFGAASAEKDRQQTSLLNALYQVNYLA